MILLFLLYLFPVLRLNLSIILSPLFQTGLYNNIFWINKFFNRLGLDSGCEKAEFNKPIFEIFGFKLLDDSVLEPLFLDAALYSIVDVLKEL